MLQPLGIRKVQNRDFAALMGISLPYITKYGHDFFKYDRNDLRQKFVRMLDGYFKVVTREDLPIAWMAASPVSPFSYSNTRCLNQSFLHSNVGGILGIRVVKLLHADLIEYAQKCKYEVVCSSSFLPNKDVFYKLLEREGWTITPIGALRKLDHG